MDGKILIPVVKTGRCANGAQRDGGRVVHAAWIDPRSFPHWGPALCGTKPGRTSGGWDVDLEMETVTCKKCAAKVNKA